MKPLARDVLKDVRSLDHILCTIKAGGVAVTFELTKKDMRKALKEMVQYNGMSDLSGHYSPDRRLFHFTNDE